MRLILGLTLTLILMAVIGSTLQPAFAGDSHFQIRADGLACPYCAYGIEKKLMKIKGVKHVDIKLEDGIVFITGEDGLKLDQKQMEKLFQDAGFTFRAIVSKTVSKTVTKGVTLKN